MLEKKKQTIIDRYNYEDDYFSAEVKFQDGEFDSIDIKVTSKLKMSVNFATKDIEYLKFISDVYNKIKGELNV